MSLRNKPISCSGELSWITSTATRPVELFYLFFPHWLLTEVRGMTHWILAFWLMTLKPALFHQRLEKEVEVKIK